MTEAGPPLGQVGVFQPGRAGDFVLTTGLFNALKDARPDCHLTVVVGPRAAALARAHPAIDRTLVLDRRPSRLAALLWGLRRRRFDLWIDPKPHASRTSALMARLVRARTRVGFNGHRRVFDRGLPGPAGSPAHYAEQALAPLALVGILPSRPRLSLGLTPEAGAWAAAQRAGAGFCVIVNISAGSRARYWPLAQWRALLPRLSRLRSTRFLLNAAPEDRDVAAGLVATASSAGADLRLLPATDLLHVAAAVAAADAVLTVDTSLVHIASAFDVPVLGIYLREEPQFTIYQPLSTRQEVVAAAAGAPMETVRPDEVEAAWERLTRDQH